MFQVVGNIEATNVALETLANPHHLTLQSILDAHHVLMKQSPTPHLGGKVRADQNWIGGNDWHPLEGDFVPPPADRCDDLLDDLVRYLRSEDHSPILQAAIAHAQFETIHPFGDGNGRTGRAVMYGVLKQRCARDGMMPPISLALSRNRDAYLSALAEFQSYLGEPGDPRRTGALVAWLEVLATAVHQSCAAVRNYQTAVGKLQNTWRVKVGGRHGRSIALAALDHLPSHPSMSVAVLAQLTSRSDRRCADALRRLESLGIVTGRRADSGLRVYDADAVFAACEVMASTICDMDASADDYADVLAAPLDQADTQEVTPAPTWVLCPLRVKSTGKPCGLVKGHGGACRHLPHRRHPPR